jgi:RecA/RadA recombinase
MYFGNNLDSCLKGPVGLILMYGPSASGKSTFAMQSSLEFAKKGRVLFLDTEKSFAIDRIKLMNPDYEKLLENIMVINIKNFEDQATKLRDIEKLVKGGKFGYVVVDSFGNFYRHALHSHEYPDVNEKAVSMLRNLKHVVEMGVPVLITNQVYETKEGGVRAIGGTMIRNFSNTILELGLEPRQILVHKPNEEKLDFKIDNLGLVP